MRTTLLFVMCVLLLTAACAQAVTYRARVLEVPTGWSVSMMDISNSGWICGGIAPSSDPGRQRACVWDPAGSFSLIPLLAGDSFAQAYHLNENGTVAFASAPVSNGSTFSPLHLESSTGTVYRGTAGTLPAQGR